MDAETQQMAEKLARFVVEGGPEMEAITIERNRDNPAFRSVTVYVTISQCLHFLPCHSPHKILSSSSFLYDHLSPAHRFYKEKVQEYRAAASQSFLPPAAELGTKLQQPAAPPVLGIPSTLNPTSLPHIQEAETPPVKRKRKSRWGSEDDKVELPIPPIIVPQEINVPDPDTPSLSGTWTCVLRTVIIAKKLVLLSLHVLIKWHKVKLFFFFFKDP